ncbi:hypothetical protein N665_0027s0034, partial [Sinapis alba]
MRYLEILFITQVEETILGISTSEINRRKEHHFIKWFKSYVDYDNPYYPTWFHELVQGPFAKVTTSP